MQKFSFHTHLKL